VKEFGQFRDRIFEFFEGDIKRNLRVGRINECFNFQNLGGQRTASCDFLQSSESVSQPRRQYIAMVDRNNRIALWQVVTESARIGVADGPLRAIAILQWLGGMRLFRRSSLLHPYVTVFPARSRL